MCCRKKCKSGDSTDCSIECIRSTHLDTKDPECRAILCKSICCGPDSSQCKCNLSLCGRRLFKSCTSTNCSGARNHNRSSPVACCSKNSEYCCSLYRSICCRADSSLCNQNRFIDRCNSLYFSLHNYFRFKEYKSIVEDEEKMDSSLNQEERLNQLEINHQEIL